MIEIKNFKDTEKLLYCYDLDTNLIKDILFCVYLIEWQLSGTDTKVFILDKDENINTKGLMLEQMENFGAYKKLTYITSDYGDGIILYKKVDEDGDII